MIPAIAANQILEGARSYTRTTFPIRNEPFASAFEEFLASAGPESLLHEPYISLRMPFRIAESFPLDSFTGFTLSFTPYSHQARAYDRLRGIEPASTIIATGTGSGKTECFLYPILEHCYLANARQRTPGIKAIIIYPMNALATDQAGRIARAIHGRDESIGRSLRGNVTAGLFVGGFTKGGGATAMGKDTLITNREAMLANPPDILLTNYKMLDYLLVRPEYKTIWQHNERNPETLKYLVVDELHTFDGAQGTDLACLIRRLKARLNIPEASLAAVGTSATIGGPESRAGILDYARSIFAEEFPAEALIEEDRFTTEEFLERECVTPKDPEDYSPFLDGAEERLEAAAAANDAAAYLEAAAEACLESPETFKEAGIDTVRGQIALGNALRENNLFHSLLKELGAEKEHVQTSKIARRLCSQEGLILRRQENLVEALLALTAHARTGSEESPRPFLDQQVQVWARELSRVAANISGEPRLDSDLNLTCAEAQQSMPVISCRDCGHAAWLGKTRSDKSVKGSGHDSIYAEFFGKGDHMTAFYPGRLSCATAPEARNDSSQRLWLCSECLHFRAADDEVPVGSPHAMKTGSPRDTPRGASRESDLPVPTDTCEECHSPALLVSAFSLSEGTRSPGKQRRQFTCPICSSATGLTLLGLRMNPESQLTATQLLSTDFEKDAKVLLFSDSVQDASHRSGFINARSYRFFLRGAFASHLKKCTSPVAFNTFVQEFCDEREAEGFERFVADFIAPNMEWFDSYRQLSAGEAASVPPARRRRLIADIRRRINVELLIEFGSRRATGRTLENSQVAGVDYPRPALAAAADELLLRAREELGLRTATKETLAGFLVSLLDTLRSAGAIADNEYSEFVAQGAKAFLISNAHRRYMPGQHATTTPRYLQPTPATRKGFLSYSSRELLRLVEKFFPFADTVATEEVMGRYDLAQLAIKALINQRLLAPLGDPGNPAYGVNQETMLLTASPVILECDTCTTRTTHGAAAASFLAGTPCMRPVCTGHMRPAPKSVPDYYGQLFLRGATRLRATEHTGLLSRERRERTEQAFKSEQSQRRPWHPNVLSSTPTLEMGIDIGDLSSLILCGIPASRASFLQRVGRAGRRDGNALVVVLADSNPHGLYFHHDPARMLFGEVRPPKLLLSASAVLERQLTAFCMDSWAALATTPRTAIPGRMSRILNDLPEEGTNPDPARFPFNFLSYVEKNRAQLLTSFLEAFKRGGNTAISEETRDYLHAFLYGSYKERSIDSTMLAAIDARAKLRSWYRSQITEITAQLKELESKPADISFDQERKELESELRALNAAKHSINNESVLGFLCNEGILPNYAFPEEGARLRTVIRHKTSEGEGERWRRSSAEYSRSADAALAEFAPGNTFYAEGRHFNIDQVDMATAEIEQWRLCPSCAYGETITTATASCPRCGSIEWADVGQQATMIRLHTVIANVDDSTSLVDDGSDTRRTSFFKRQLLVDIDTDTDVTASYVLESAMQQSIFGFSYARKATIRDINFGTEEGTERSIPIAGDLDTRSGFALCAECGHIRAKNEKGIERINHANWCSARNDLEAETEKLIEGLFLYREFTSEALRILVPSTDAGEAADATIASFIAALHLGLAEHFGNVEHLKMNLSTHPKQAGGQRATYLDIYDSVPGGTGYLKELAQTFEVFETAILRSARDALEGCPSCSTTGADGCYRCIFSYRPSHSRENYRHVSRRRALAILNELLDDSTAWRRQAHGEQLVDSSALESELEKLFIEALRAWRGPNGESFDICRQVVGGRDGYMMTFSHETKEIAWTIEPQVALGPAEGVSVSCRPDFLIRPASKALIDAGRAPLAVFTDGFEFHSDSVADDFLKREAIRASGKYEVFSFTWRDVQEARGESCANYVNYTERSRLPLRAAFDMVMEKAGLDPADGYDRLGPIERFGRFLFDVESHRETAVRAGAFAAGMLRNQSGTETKQRALQLANAFAPVALAEIDEEATGETFTGVWEPYAGLVSIVSAAQPDSLIRQHIDAQWAVFDDTNPGAGGYQEEWNGLLALANLMQFSPGFHVVTEKGLEDSIYENLVIEPQGAHQGRQSPPHADASAPGGDPRWEQAFELIVDSDVKDFARRIQALGIEAPTAVGDEDEAGFVLELVWENPHACYLPRWAGPEEREHLTGEGWSIVESSMPDDALVEKLGKENRQ